MDVSATDLFVLTVILKYYRGSPCKSRLIGYAVIYVSLINSRQNTYEIKANKIDEQHPQKAYRKERRRTVKSAG